MKLYKNVAVKDIESILEKGLLSLDVCGNNNWENGKRADNRTDVVYLHSPKTEQNTFTNYGIALVEVEIDNAEQSEIPQGDRHGDLYDEYIVSQVAPEDIKAIYIPDCMEKLVNLSAEAMKKVTFCKFKAYNLNYDYSHGLFPTVTASEFTKADYEKFYATVFDCEILAGYEAPRVRMFPYNVQYIF